MVQQRLTKKQETVQKTWKALEKIKPKMHKLAFEKQCTNFNKKLLNSKKSYILSSIKNSIKDSSKLYMQ